VVELLIEWGSNLVVVLLNLMGCSMPLCERDRPWSSAVVPGMSLQLLYPIRQWATTNLTVEWGNHDCSSISLNFGELHGMGVFACKCGLRVTLGRVHAFVVGAVAEIRLEGRHLSLKEVKLCIQRRRFESKSAD